MCYLFLPSNPTTRSYNIQVKIDVDAFKANESQVLDSQRDIMDTYRGNHANNGHTTYARKGQERVKHLADNTLGIPNP
jgi:hypothetical protein